MRIGGLQPTSLVDYPGTVSSVVFTVGCNFRCPYCHNAELVYETPERIIDEEEVFGFLESHRGVLPAVVVTGGEPTMHEDLPQFLARLRAMGFLVKLDSNGTHPKMLKDIVSAGSVQYIAMDIKAPLAHYSRSVGAAVNTDAIQESVAFLREGMVDYEFRTTVVRSQLTPEDIMQIGKEIQGARRYYLQQFNPLKTLHPSFHTKLAYSRVQLDDMAGALSPYVDYCGVRA